MKNLRFFLVAFLVGTTSFALAQSYSVVNESSTLSILGTSTLHDWKLNADTINGDAEISILDKKLKGIKSLNINVPVASMHSGLDPLDKHMRMALTANEATSIDFKITAVTNISSNTIGGYTIQATGDVTIINNIQEVRLQATMEFQENGNIRFFGETMIDMTDYEVELPQAEMGSIKSEKDVKIIFDVVLKK